MGSSQAELNLAENERKILNAGRIPYESFKVSESNPLAPPSPPPIYLNARACLV